MLQNYFEDELYERLKELLISGAIDFEDMGAFALRQDIRTRLSTEVVIATNNDEVSVCRFAVWYPSSKVENTGREKRLSSVGAVNASVVSNDRLALVSAIGERTPLSFSELLCMA